jgi:hypothetical protein
MSSASFANNTKVCNNSSSTLDLKHIFIHFKAEKDCSVEQFDVSVHKNIHSAMSVLGKTDYTVWPCVKEQDFNILNLF